MFKTLTTADLPPTPGYRLMAAPSAADIVADLQDVCPEVVFDVATLPEGTPVIIPGGPTVTLGSDNCIVFLDGVASVCVRTGEAA